MLSGIPYISLHVFAYGGVYRMNEMLSLLDSGVVLSICFH